MSISDYAQAKPLAAQAVRVVRNSLVATAAIQSERQQLVMLKENRSYLQATSPSESVWNNPRRSCFRRICSGKERSLSGSMPFRQLRYIDDPQVQQLLGELTETARRRATLSFQTPNPQQADAWREQLAALATRQAQLETELSRRSALFNQGQQAAELTPQQLQELLLPRTALIDFLQSGGEILTRKNGSNNCSRLW